jgi:hypothetical protein
MLVLNTVDVLYVLNHVVTKKRVLDVFACVATRATVADMKTVEVESAAQAVEKEVLAADTTVIADLAQVDLTEVLQVSAVQAVLKDALAEKEVHQAVQLEVLADALADGNSKKVVLRKRSTNFKIRQQKRPRMRPFLIHDSFLFLLAFTHRSVCT